jgi:hypothetical protein
VRLSKILVLYHLLRLQQPPRKTKKLKTCFEGLANIALA